MLHQLVIWNYILHLKVGTELSTCTMLRPGILSESPTFCQSSACFWLLDLHAWAVPLWRLGTRLSMRVSTPRPTSKWGPFLDFVNVAIRSSLHFENEPAGCPMKCCDMDIFEGCTKYVKNILLWYDPMKYAGGLDQARLVGSLRHLALCFLTAPRNASCCQLLRECPRSYGYGAHQRSSGIID